MDYTAVGIHDFYTFLLVFARLGGLIVTAPLFSNAAIPKTIRAGLVFVFSFVLTPLAIPRVGPVPTHVFLFAAVVFKEALFGVAAGYISSLLFSAVEMAGFFMDTQMGFGMINLLNPFSQHQDSVLSAFQYQLAMTLYLLSNGHLLFLGALAQSFQTLPPGTGSPHTTLGMIVVPVLKMMFVLGFRMALPVAGVLLVVDVAFGLVARMVPQINVFIVGTPAKIIMGLATISMLLPVMAIYVGQITQGTLAGLQTLIAGLK